ncbi:hypothetical protein Hanom_Chr11g00980801 [Helianthus anomalus]
MCTLCVISNVDTCMWTRLDSTRRDSVRFDPVRFGSSPTSRHSSVVRPRVRHAKHGAPRAGSRRHITMTSS